MTRAKAPETLLRSLDAMKGVSEALYDHYLEAAKPGIEADPIYKGALAAGRKITGLLPRTGHMKVGSVMGGAYDTFCIFWRITFDSGEWIDFSQIVGDAHGAQYYDREEKV